MAAIYKFFTKVATEVGLFHLINSPLDTKILCLQRFFRFLAYGCTALILVLFLRALEISETRIGLFMTLTLFGDLFISFILTLIADGIGRRRILALGAALMAGSGVVFALSSNYWILLMAAVLGVISPSGNEIGPFRAIEESTIAHLTTKEDRTGLLAWYAVFGYGGTSLGVLIGGWVLQVVQTKGHWEPLESYRLVFWAYAVLGGLKFMLCLLLSRRCELEKEKDEPKPDDERRPLLADEQVNPANSTTTENNASKSSPQPKTSPLTHVLPSMSRQTAALVLKLCFLFALDSIASGLIGASWVTYFFAQKFSLRESQLGTLFFIANIFSTLSNFAAAPLARRIGLVKTMVFTHIPASIALGLIPFPNDVDLAVALMLLRYSMSSMDQAPRQAFLAAAVRPSERTAVMGTVNVVKTLSQSVGPVITGALAGKGLFWVSFVVAGGLKVLYDALMLGMFLGYRGVDDEAEERAGEGETRERVEEAGPVSGQDCGS